MCNVLQHGRQLVCDSALQSVCVAQHAHICTCPNHAPWSFFAFLSAKAIAACPHDQIHSELSDVDKAMLGDNITAQYPANNCGTQVWIVRNLPSVVVRLGCRDFCFKGTSTKDAASATRLVPLRVQLLVKVAPRRLFKCTLGAGLRCASRVALAALALTCCEVLRCEVIHGVADRLSPVLALAVMRSSRPGHSAGKDAKAEQAENKQPSSSPFNPYTLKP